MAYIPGETPGAERYVIHPNYERMIVAVPPVHVRLAWSDLQHNFETYFKVCFFAIAVAYLKLVILNTREGERKAEG